MPAKAGIQGYNESAALDSRLRGNDDFYAWGQSYFRAVRIACQTRSGLAGMSSARTPSG